MLTGLKYIILSTSTITLIFGIVFLFLSRQEQKSYMKIWGFCWIIYFIIFIMDFGRLGASSISSSYILNKQIMNLVTSFLFLWGTYNFFHLKFHPNIIVVCIFSAITIFAGMLFHDIYEIFLIPNVLIGTGLMAWAGCIFYIYTWTENVPEKHFIFFLLIIWSICSNNFAFILPNLSLSTFNYFTSLLVLNITIIFLLILYFKKLNYQLAHQEARYRMLVENSMEHIFLFHYGKQKFEYISPSAVSIFGNTMQELYDDAFLLLKNLKAADTEKINTLLTQAITSPSMDTFQVLSKDGSAIICEIHYTPIFDDAGTPISLEWILRDITEKVSAEEHLKAAERQRKELLENISHEIKTPITLIQGYAEAIVNNIVSPHSVNSYLKNILSKSELLNTLLNDLLQVSQLTSQTLEFRFYETDAKEFFDKIFSQCESHITSANFKSICNNDIKDDISIIIDSQRIEQVLSNLINNAIRYAGKQGTIYLSCIYSNTLATVSEECSTFPLEDALDEEAAQVGEIVVKVVDSGKGFDPEDIPKLFQRNYRGKNTNSASSGLGLSISKQIISQHSGRIWAKNEVGMGAALFFTLPCYFANEKTEIEH